MNNDDMFTIYLPSNSPGAKAQSLSEDTLTQVSSWYKTTLDGTIDLDGDGWEVGLAEICFPSKLLSLLEEFEIGIAIINPPQCFVKKVRQEHLEKLKARNEAPAGDNISIAQTFPLLDYISEYFGEEDESDGKITIATPPAQAVASVSGDGKITVEVYPAEPVASLDGNDDVVSKTPVIPEPAPRPDRSELLTKTTPESPAVVPAESTTSTPTAKVVDRSQMRQDTTELSGLSILARVKQKPSLPPPAYANQDMPGTINVDDLPGTINVHDMVESIIEGVRAKFFGLKEPDSTTGIRKTSKTTNTEKSPTSAQKPGRKKYKWYIFRAHLIALGEILPIENTLYPEICRIPGGFYASRGELVNILNQRMAYFLNNRTYPGRDWSMLLFEPFFHGRDSGLVTVSTGFFDPLTDTGSPYIHLVPTITSLRALKFLGLDLSKWKWNASLRTYVYTIAEKSEYMRRDSAVPITLPIRGPNDVVPMFRKAGTGPTLFSANEANDLGTARIRINYEKLEKFFVSDFAQQRNNLLKPKTSPPQFLFVYVDIARPVVVGNTRASVLRITSLKSREDSNIQTNASAAAGISNPAFVRYYQNEPERFTHIIYVPVSRRSFNTITVFLSDENGSQLAFDEGTVYVVLQFRKRLPFSQLITAMST